MTLRNYEKKHCWQYDIRLKNYVTDVKLSGLDEDELVSLRCPDFSLQYEPKENVFNEIKDFIVRHEWLGKLGLSPTHFFTARYKDVLAGVVVMDMPNAFSKMLGENTRKIERLISRGACISWSPKNLASSLISFSTNWMAKNTQYRLFTAYSDPEARELGTIYQACNFYYLGQKFGAKEQYLIENGKWVSDRYFRSRSVYKRMAKALEIEWLPEWQGQTGNKDKVNFEHMPVDVAESIKRKSKNYQQSCNVRQIPPKHKYAFVAGENRKETKELRKQFENLNKVYDYPKERTSNK